MLDLDEVGDENGITYRTLAIVLNEAQTFRKASSWRQDMESVDEICEKLLKESRLDWRYIGFKQLSTESFKTRELVDLFTGVLNKLTSWESGKRAMILFFKQMVLRNPSRTHKKTKPPRPRSSTHTKLSKPQQKLPHPPYRFLPI